MKIMLESAKDTLDRCNDEWVYAQEQIRLLRDAFNAGEPWDDLCTNAYQATLSALDNDQMAASIELGRAALTEDGGEREQI